MRLLPALAAALLISTAAAAQPDAPPPPPPGMGGPNMQGGPGGPGGPHMNMRQRFEAANVTHDGRLTREQAEAAGLRGILRNFDQIDMDRKGYVTLQDLRAFAQARRAQRGAQPPGQQLPPPPPPT